MVGEQVTLKPISLDDIVAVDGLDEYRTVEIVDGMWVEKHKDDSMSIAHGMLNARMTAHLWNYIQTTQVGVVYVADTIFILHVDDNGVRAMRKPDVPLVTTVRVKPAESGYYHQAPDLAVEIISPSERIGIVRKKLRDYFAYGTQQVWLVYPEDQEIAVYTASDAYEVHRSGDTLSGGDLLPGFRLDIAALFAAQRQGE